MPQWFDAWATSTTSRTSVGVLSESYGITMASGALARYLHSPVVEFHLDRQGPADRSDPAVPHGHVPYDMLDDLP